MISITTRTAGGGGGGASVNYYIRDKRVSIFIYFSFFHSNAEIIGPQR